MDDTTPPRVFISYSHDSEAHRALVLGLSERLRADGMETRLDRYVPNGSPAQTWPRWMMDGLDWATHVLCVCTPTYYRRFRGHEEPGKGKGADWEGALITQEIYDARSRTTQFIPVLFTGATEAHIPEPLRGKTHYRPDTQAGFGDLYDALLNQGGIAPRPLGTLKRKPRATAEPLRFADHAAPEARSPATPPQPAQPQIAASQLGPHAARTLFGRETELLALDAAWAKPALNIYSLVAWGGTGKTALVFHWVETRLRAKGWPGVARYLDWSFYSQGTGEGRQTSADMFMAKALAFFGDADPTQGSAYERGERLAGLIRQQRTLLVLDGIEPLQYPPNDPQAGQLKDPGLAALLRGLAAHNPGLVVLTTREPLADLDGYTATTHAHPLDRLSPEAGVALLRHLQITGTEAELHDAAQAAGRHALTLNLLGRYLADAYEDRDIRHWRELKFEAADAEHQGRSAFKVMQAYTRWLASAGPERQRELALLRLTGLFDRPMAKACLQALRAEPAIPGLTDALVTLTPQQWNLAVKRLVKVDLLSETPDALDAHPLVREFFAQQWQQTQPATWEAGHSRLFDHLCASTPYRPDGLDGLAPLYQAVHHGCLAGRQQEACAKVYIDRILRGTEFDGFYSTKQLGAVGADLAAVAAFFEASPAGPWQRPSPRLSGGDQAWLLIAAAYSLRALGRLAEALQPMQAGLTMDVQQKHWQNAAIAAGNLSELALTLGRVPDAVDHARQAVAYADQSGDAFQRMVNRTTSADALHQAGQRAEAGALFAEAEGMQRERQPAFECLYSLRGFQFCDWLLAATEQAAWQQVLGPARPATQAQLSADLAEVERRAGATLQWANKYRVALLDIAFSHLTLARVALIRTILETPTKRPQPTLALPQVTTAVTALRTAASMNHLPRGLLAAALYHALRGEPALAEQHLAEAQQIAERGPMPLVLADVHLHRARLFRDRAALARAAELIHQHGYGRRAQELADAQAALA